MHNMEPFVEYEKKKTFETQNILTINKQFQGISMQRMN